MLTAPYNSPGSLVFLCQRCPRNSTGVTPYTGAPNAGGVGNNRRLSTNDSLYLGLLLLWPLLLTLLYVRLLRVCSISLTTTTTTTTTTTICLFNKLKYSNTQIWKTVQDRRIVCIKVVCVLSNCHIADDLEWPLTTPIHPNFYICTAFHISVTSAGIETSNLVYRLAITSPSWPVCRWKIIPRRGVFRVTWSMLKFYAPWNICRRTKARESKFCIRTDHVKY